MENTLKLKKPLLIDGEKVTEFKYYTDEITVQLYKTAAKKAEAGKMDASGVTITMAEIDYDMHLYLGYAAIIAVNPSVDWADLDRLKGSDITAVMNIGRNFILTADDVAAETSAEHSESTPELSTAQSKTSKKSQ